MRKKFSQINKDDVYFATKHNRITGSLGLELVWREKPEVGTEEIYEALRTEEGGGRGGRGGGSHQLILGQCCGQLKYNSMAVHIYC